MPVYAHQTSCICKQHMANGLYLQQSTLEGEQRIRACCTRLNCCSLPHHCLPPRALNLPATLNTLPTLNGVQNSCERRASTSCPDDKRGHGTLAASPCTHCQDHSKHLSATLTASMRSATCQQRRFLALSGVKQRYGMS